MAVTAVLEPHLLLRPAAAPDSCSPSALPVPGDNLLPGKTRKKKSPQAHVIFSISIHDITNPCTQLFRTNISEIQIIMLMKPFFYC